MSQPTLLDIKTANKAQQPPASQPLERDERETMPKIESILLDAALEVAALIDAVCCRCGDWFDWQYYRPLPGIGPNNRTAPDSVIRLALLEDIFGLRCGGYIEMCAAYEERVI